MKFIQHNRWKILLVFVVIAVCCLVFCLFRGDNSHEDGQRLHLTLTATGNAYYHSYSPEDLGNNYDGDLVYVSVDDVQITLGAKTLPLTEAIASGQITVEEIIAAARIDARNHYCREVSETKNGLTKFVYQYYNQFDLGVYYDIYETPSRGIQQINNVRIYEYTAGTREGIQFRTTDQNGDDIAIDREDWGLQFEVLEATPTYVDFQITQAGGQQFGALEYQVMSFFDLNQSVNLVEPFPWPDKRTEIPSGEVSMHRIDWSDTLGELAPGEYYLQLRVKDVFDADDLHPFTKDFYDEQSYDFIFEIP